MADEISDLRIFAPIVDAGSLSEAARRLSSSLPTVSRRLAALESRLGVRLIDRSSRKFLLTEEGHVLHGRAATIIAAIDDAEAEASSAVDAAQGRLRVSAPQQIGRCRVAGLVAEFAALHPRIEIEYVVTDRRLGVREEDLDVAIQTKRPTDGDVIHRRLLASRRVVCASPEYLNAHGTTVALSDLQEHNCIRMSRARDVYSRWRFCEDGEERLVEVSGNPMTKPLPRIDIAARIGRACMATPSQGKLTVEPQ